MIEQIIGGAMTFFAGVPDSYFRYSGLLDILNITGILDILVIIL